MFLDVGDYTDAGYIAWETWEPANSAFLLRIFKNATPQTVFVDGGANVGYFSLLVGANSPARVFAIEPVRRNRVVIEKNITTNNLPQIALIPVAVGDKKGETEIQYGFLNSGSGSITDDLAQGDSAVGMYIFKEDVHVDTIEHIFDMQKIEQCLCMKLDIQGGELSALQGSENLLKEKRITYLLVEHTDAAGNTVRDYLASLGYKAHVVHADGSLTELKASLPLLHKHDYVYAAGSAV
jgi:FkbM family methyltransferase